MRERSCSHTDLSFLQITQCTHRAYDVKPLDPVQLQQKQYSDSALLNAPPHALVCMRRYSPLTTTAAVKLAVSVSCCKMRVRRPLQLKDTLEVCTMHVNVCVCVCVCVVCVCSCLHACARACVCMCACWCMGMRVCVCACV